MSELKEINLGEIKVGEHEQRIEYDEDYIQGLATSITDVGLINPLCVARRGDGYILIAGHCRFAALRKLGRVAAMCVIGDDAKGHAAKVTFAENFHRRDLSPVEQASAIADCFKQGVMTIEELASAFHRKAYWVNCQIAMLDWPPDVLQAVHLKQLSVSAAANLAVVLDDIYRNFLLGNAVESGATARSTAAWLQAWRSNQPAEEAVTAEPLPPGSVPVPAVPQLPCLCCGMVHPANEMSHVPICSPCIGTLRSVGGA